MKKFFKFVFTIVIISSIAFGVYFLFFRPVSKQTLFAQTQTLFAYDDDGDVYLTESTIYEMKNVLLINDINGNGTNALNLINEYLENNIYFKNILSYTNENVLCAQKIENYRKEIKSYYNQLISNYNKCANYISDYYLTIDNRTDSSISIQDKGALINYINNFSIILKDLYQSKINYLKYLCLCQSNAYNNNINQTPVNSLYLEVAGYSIEYINQNQVEFNGQVFAVNTSAIKNYISKINSNKELYYNNISKYENIREIKGNIDCKDLVVSYILGNETEFLDKIVSTSNGQPVSETATKKYNNSVYFLNEVLK